MQFAYDFYYCASYNNGLIDITQYDCCCQSDIAPPGEVTNFSVSNSDKKITISWTDPDDEDWDHTILVRKIIMDKNTVEPENENRLRITESLSSYTLPKISLA